MGGHGGRYHSCGSGRRAVGAGAVLLIVVALVAACAIPPPQGFRVFRAPVTGVVDVVAGLPTCGGLGGAVAADGDVWAVDETHDWLRQYRPPGAARVGVRLGNWPGGVAPACAGVPAGLGGDLFLNDADGVLELVDPGPPSTVRVVATGGLR